MWRVACNVALVGVLSAAAGPSTVRAEEVSSDASARATALFAEGAKLLDEGRAREACPKLEAAVTLTRRSALGGMLTLADCYVGTGRVASAWGLYNEVLSKASAAGQSERAREAEDKGTALAARVPRLILEVPPELQQLQSVSVWINGTEQPSAGLAGGIPVDYGALSIEVRVPARPTAHASVLVLETDREVALVLPVPSEPMDAPPKDVASVHPVRETSFWSTGRFVGLGVGSVGVVAVITGLALGGVASSAYDAGLAEGNCFGSPPVCDELGPIDAARTLGDVATGLLFAGLGVSVTGALVFALGSDAEASTAPAVSLHVYPNAVRMEVPVW